MKIIRSGFELDNGTSGGVSANTFYPQADKPKEEIKKEQESINSSLSEYFSEGFKIEDKIVNPFVVIIILNKIIK